MKVCNLAGKIGEQFCRQVVAFLAHIKQLALIELAHANGVLERGAVTAQPRLFRGAGNRHHLQIEFGRQATVQSQLFLAEAFAAFQGGKIQEPEIHGFLDLVGKVTGEQNL